PELLAEAGRQRARIAAAARVIERLEREVERLHESRPRRDLARLRRVTVVPHLDRMRQSGQAQGRRRHVLSPSVDPDLRLRRLACDLYLAVLGRQLDGHLTPAVGFDGKLPGYR